MQVLRLVPGDRVRLFDGAGREVEACLRVLTHAGGEADVLRPLASDSEPLLHCVLVQGLPVKLQRMETVVRQATEVGVHSIVPVVGMHSQLRSAGREMLSNRTERWRRVVTAAAKQCGRATIPTLADTVDWDGLCWPRLPAPRWLLDQRASRSIGAAIAGVETVPETVTLMVGPEGGWDASEVETASAQGVQRIALGPRVLRADTAGAAALAVLMNAWGDWN